MTLKKPCDYTEKSLFKFNKEIMSLHFGNHATLSIEGVSMSFYTWNEIQNIIIIINKDQI